MKTNVISLYKVPLLISITLAMALFAFRPYSNPIEIAMILLGCFFGTFVLDIEYIIYAYIFEPNKEFSKTLSAFFKHMDFFNAAQYIEFHKHDIKEKSLNSAIFQIVAGLFSIFVVMSSAPLIVKALVLSVFANSIYRMAESYFENKLDDWFWALKNIPNVRGLVLYSLGLFSILVFCLYSF